MSATRTEAVTASEHLGMLNSSLEFVNQKLHNNLTRPSGMTLLCGIVSLWYNRASNQMAATKGCLKDLT